MQGQGYLSQELVETGGKTAWSKRALRSIKDQYEKTGGYHELEKMIDDDYYDRNQNFFSGPLGGRFYEWMNHGLRLKSRTISPSHLLILLLAVLGETLEATRKLCYRDNSPSLHFRPPMFFSVPKK
jgi:hypothetical protein